MDARNTGPDWPRPPTAQYVVMGVAVVTGLPNGPGLSGWIKSDNRVPSQRCLRPFLGLLPLGAPRLNDVIEAGSLAQHCAFKRVCVCVWVCWKRRHTGNDRENDDDLLSRPPHPAPSKKKVLVAATVLHLSQKDPAVYVTAGRPIWMTWARPLWGIYISLLPDLKYDVRQTRKHQWLWRKSHSPAVYQRQQLSNTDANTQPLCGRTF